MWQVEEKRERRAREEKERGKDWWEGRTRGL